MLVHLNAQGLVFGFVMAKGKKKVAFRPAAPLDNPTPEFHSSPLPTDLEDSSRCDLALTALDDQGRD